MLFKEKLVILRKSRGLTQDEFASAVGVSRQAVYKWECGQSYPEVPKLLEMKLLLGISIDELLDDSFDIPVPEKKKRRRKISKEDKAQIEAAVSADTTAAAAAAKAVEAPKAEPAPVKEEPKAQEPKIEAPKEAKAEKKTPVKAAAPAPKAEPAPIEPVKAEPDKNVLDANDKASSSLDDALSALEKLEKRKGLFSKLFSKK